MKTKTGMSKRLQQLFCWHTRLPHWEGGRITLRCVACDHDTPGWDVIARSRVTPPLRFPHAPLIPIQERAAIERQLRKRA